MNLVPIITSANSVGYGLCRPESVVACADGHFFVSDLRGLVTRIDPAGHQQVLGSPKGLPNGIALCPDGGLAVADMAERKIHRLSMDGADCVLFSEINGQPLGAVNFILCGRSNDLWISISTQHPDLSVAIAQPRPDGQILYAKDETIEIVSEGLYFANELRFDADYEWMYVAETTQGRIRRAKIDGGRRLGDWESYGPAPFFAGAYVDGIAFDAAGNLWVTELSRNAIFVITPDQSLHCLIDDPKAQVLCKPTSIAFCGQDLKTAVIGSLKATELKAFRSSTPGLPMEHWPVVNPPRL